jgi:hypothetical protein
MADCFILNVTAPIRGADGKGITEMATTQVVETANGTVLIDKTETAVTTGPPAGLTWEVIRTEQPDRIIFEDEGDNLIGLYIGSEVINPPATEKDPEPEPFTQLLWRNAIVNGERMEFVCTNAGFALEQAFKGIDPDTWTRVTLMKLVTVKNQPSKMKDFRVEVAR